MSDALAVDGKGSLVTRLLGGLPDGVAVKAVRVGDRLDLNAEIFFQKFLGAGEFALKPG